VDKGPMTTPTYKAGHSYTDRNSAAGSFVCWVRYFLYYYTAAAAGLELGVACWCHCCYCFRYQDGLGRLDVEAYHQQARPDDRDHIFAFDQENLVSGMRLERLGTGSLLRYFCRDGISAQVCGMRV
jgi:hypothetical protein